MAKRKPSIDYTDITTGQAEKFLRTADENRTLKCGKIRGFFLLQKSTGGVWRYRYLDAAGKRRTATVGKYQRYLPNDAAKIVHDWIEGDVDPLAKKTSRREVALRDEQQAQLRSVGHYLERSYRPMMERYWQHNTARLNYQRLHKHFADLMDRDMTTLNKLDMDAFIDRMEQKGRKFSTVKRVWGSLQTMLNTAVKDGVIDQNPIGHLKVSPSIGQQDGHTATQDAQKARRRMLEPDEIEAIYCGLQRFAEEHRAARRNSRKHGKPHLPDLDGVHYAHWFEPFCLLALHTGMRPGDLRTLTWQELNMRFQRLVKVPEKSRRVSLRRERKPAVIDYPLHSDQIEVMHPWWVQQGRPENGLVFPSPRTGRELDSKAYWKPWTRVLELGGLNPEALDFYATRHHFISAQVAAGLPMLAVAHMVGQKSVAMIEQHYGHLRDDAKDQALSIVSQSLKPRDQGKESVSKA